MSILAISGKKGVGHVNNFRIFDIWKQQTFTFL